jgi:hypothetical protein
LLHTNSAINFGLYIFCGSKFRRDLKNLFCKRRRTISQSMHNTRSFHTQSVSTVSSEGEHSMRL